jgi:hypothetical protein
MGNRAGKGGASLLSTMLLALATTAAHGSGFSSKAPSPGGVWSGTLSFSDGSSKTISGEIDEKGNGYLADLQGDVYSTSAAVIVDSTGHATMSFNLFIPANAVTGSAASMSAAQFYGQLVSRSSMTGTFSEKAGTKSGTFSIKYVPVIYNLPASDSVVAGTYTYATRVQGSSDTISLTIASNGTITGSDSKKYCSISGRASVPNLLFNAYDLAMTWSCADGQHSYKGVGLYEPVSVTIPGTSYSTPRSLVMEYDDGVAAATVATAIRK